MNLEETKKLFENDRFATGMGAQISSLGSNEAICTLNLDDSHRNAANNIQGGAVFTLADFAFGVASNPDGIRCVSHSCHITFLKATKGSVLTAHAKLISNTRRTCTYEVRVTDDLGTTVAVCIFNGQVVTNI